MADTGVITAHAADSRPEVYEENGVLVIRASAIGGCIRNLVAARMGIRAVPFNDRALMRMEEGNIHEPHILKHLETLGWEFSSTQDELELPIAGGCIIIRGHSDGHATHQHAHLGERVVEAKALGRDTWDKWKQHGWAEFRRYAYQFSGYMIITGLGGVFAVKNRDTGEVDVTYWDEPPVSANDLKARALKVAAATELPECDPAVWGCFAAGTLVLTDDGYRPIETVQVGDRVLTHRGRWRKVTHLKPVESKATRMMAVYGTPEIVTTDGHPFLARERSYHHRSRAKLVREFTDAEWVPAEKLGRDSFVAQVLPPVDDRAPQLTTPQWWLVGRWVADGTIERDRYVKLGVGPDKADSVEEQIRASGWVASRREQPTATVFYFRQPGAVEFSNTLSGFGKLAHGKRLPGFMFTLDRDSAKAFLDGYLAGDGHRRHAGYQRYRNDYWTATTTSRELAYGIALLAQRAYGTLASITTATPSATTLIEGREVNQRPFWVVRIPLDAKATRGRSWFIEADLGWKPVRSSRATGHVKNVYDLTIEEDESYVVQGVVAHNCPRFFIHTDAAKGTEIDPFTGLEVKKSTRLPPVPHEVPTDFVPAFEELARAYDEARAEEKRAEVKRREVGGFLLAFLAEHHLKKGVTEAWTVTEVVSRTQRLDQKGLRASYPDVADQFTVESETRYVKVTPREEVT